MLLFHALSLQTHFWPASTLFRGHLALATLSLLVNDPQILEHWGAHQAHLGKCNRGKDFGLELWHDVTRLLMNRTDRIGFRVSEFFHKIDEDFGHSIS